MKLSQDIVNICYLVSAVLFILDLKWMAHPKTAVRGNRAGVIAMALAVVATLFSDAYTLAHDELGQPFRVKADLTQFAARNRSY